MTNFYACFKGRFTSNEASLS